MPPRLIGKPRFWSKARNDVLSRICFRCRLAPQKTFAPSASAPPREPALDEKSFDISPPNSVKPGYGGIHFIMSKIKLTLSGFMFVLLLLFGLSRVFSRNPDNKNN